MGDRCEKFSVVYVVSFSKRPSGAPGSKVTLAQDTRAGAGATFNMSMRTEPVKYSAGPRVDG